MLSTTKKLFFAGFTFFLIVIVFIGFEFFTRKMYPELAVPLVNEVTYDQIQWYHINRSYLKKYFPTGDYIIPEFKPALFRKEKTHNTIRILCLGESSMFGVPYQMTANISGILRRQLRHMYPEKEIEVINFGASAINTNVILHFSPGLLQFKPDMVLIYTGHNEFYGPDGVGASWLEKQFPFLTQWKYDLRELAVVKFFQSFGESSLAVPQPQDANLMKQVSKSATIELQSADAERVFANFQRNLEKIVELFLNENIPLIISDVTSNLTFPPFEYDTTITEELTPVQRLLSAKQYSQALDTLRQIEQHHSNNAYVNYVLGTTSLVLNKFDDAKHYLEKARDNDLLKFRAPGKINSIIKQICIKKNVPFFSSDSIFIKNSTHGISDTSLFWEHLHPNPYGYYLIADGFFDKIVERGIFPPPSKQRLTFTTDSLHICWLDLAFGDMTIKNLTSKWPFRNYNAVTRVYASSKPELQDVVKKVFLLEKVWDQGCYESAQIFWKDGKMNDAITTYRAIIDEYPFNFYAHYLLANALSQTGRIDEAISHYQISIRSNPLYPFPKVDLGLLQINRGEFDNAIALLSNALTIAQQDRLNPLQSTIYYGLATAYANKRDFRQAMVYIEQSLQLQPQNRDALMLREKIATMMYYLVEP